jgi:hypothetical protein
VKNAPFPEPDQQVDQKNYDICNFSFDSALLHFLYHRLSCTIFLDTQLFWLQKNENKKITFNTVHNIIKERFLLHTQETIEKHKRLAAIYV